MATESIDIEPQWSNMGQVILENKMIDTLTPILNLYQGYRDFLKRKDTAFSRAFLKSIVDEGFNIQDLKREVNQ